MWLGASAFAGFSNSAKRYRMLSVYTTPRPQTVIQTDFDILLRFDFKSCGLDRNPHPQTVIQIDFNILLWFDFKSYGSDRNWLNCYC
ncbi:hypothetical protein LZ31DRAFT_86571 [Colletotrichum somersetense]|nr:hypothetical protein LZ31DRAFT_86571 [Colletotrichum somersetense]